MISISFCGWLELEEESIHTSRKKTTLVNMDIGSITMLQTPWKTAWCISYHIIEHGRLTLRWASQKVMIQTEMQIQDTKTSNCTISLKRSPAINGLSEFTRETKGTTEKPSSFWNKEIINYIWTMQSYQRAYSTPILMQKKQRFDPTS